MCFVNVPQYNITEFPKTVCSVLDYNLVRAKLHFFRIYYPKLVLFVLVNAINAAQSQNIIELLRYVYGQSLV